MPVKKIRLMFFLLIISGSLNSFGEIIPPPVQDIGGPELYSIEIPNDPLINYYTEQYLSPDGLKTLSAVLNRGSVYLGFIYDLLAEKQLPPELMYLPAIESGFYSWAVSSSGAAGLWQFMMNSISPYDISVNEWQDDRRDFWKASKAALHKLEFNYERLGSWPLAIAAYNCGLGRVERAVSKAGTKDYIELYEMGYLPKQTRHYIPKFFAFCSIAGYPSRFGLKNAVSAQIYSPERTLIWHRIRLDQSVDLRLLSDAAGIPYEILRKSNAELRYSITPPADDGYFLKVPAAYSDNIKSALARNDQPLLRFYIHEIGSGDTFYALSRHFGVSVEMIESYNPGIEPRSLRTGQKVVIPALMETEPYRSSVNQSERWMNAERYIVKSGDTLWGIARDFSTSAEEIAFNNGIKTDGILKVGTVLQVPGVKSE